MSSAALEVVDLAAEAGLYLDPWQVAALEDMLGVGPDGRWAAFEAAFIVPRQNGKGAILEARELGGLFLFGERLIVHTAHELKTAMEAFRRIRELIESTPMLGKRVWKILQNNNDMSIELDTGQRLKFIARTGASGRGFSGDVLILDEAYELDRERMSALIPTMSARPNPQLIYMSSAPHDSIGSEMLRRLCRRGRAGTSPSLVYVEYSASLDCDPADPVAWAEANPGIPTRISEEHVALEREALAPEEFARERLGHWSEVGTLGSRVIGREVWAACGDLRSRLAGEGVFALDVADARDFASFAVAGVSTCGGHHVELVERRSGTDWVVGRAQELQGRWGGKLIVAKGSPADALTAELKAAGVKVTLASGAEHAQACGMFYDAVTQRMVRHTNDPALAIAVDAADRRFTGDAWVWSRRLSTTDISPLVAVTLALWGARQPQSAAPWLAYV